MNKLHYLLTIVDHFRSQLNPLRGLNMPRVIDMLESGERGDYGDLQWTYRMVEKRSATLRACKRNLASSLMELDHKVKIMEWAEADPNTKALAERQATALTKAYERIENLREALQHLALADFRGFAHLEKAYAPELVSVPGGSGGVYRPINRLEPVPQWHFGRNGIYGEWEYFADSNTATANGENPVETSHFLIREVEDPINEIALIAFVRQNMAQKDWDGFLETYGIPWLFFILPDGVKPGDPGYDEWITVANQAQSDSRGTLPSGTQVETANVNARNHPFDEYQKRQDNEIILAATSSLLTMTTEAGSGTLAGGAHSDTFERIARAQAMLVSEIFQEQFDKPMLQTMFPGQPIMCYFEWAAKDEEDIGDILENARRAKDAGFQADVAEISEKTGLKLTVSAPAPTPGVGDRPGLPGQTKAIDQATKDALISVLGVGGTQALMDVIGRVTTGQLPQEEALAVLDTVFGIRKDEAIRMLPANVQRQLVAHRGNILQRGLRRIGRIFHREEEEPQVVADNTPEELDEAMRKDLVDLYDRIDAIRELDDETAQKAAMQKLSAELPQILQKAIAGQSTVDAIERILGTAITAGAVNAETDTPTDPEKS